MNRLTATLAIIAALALPLVFAQPVSLPIAYQGIVFIDGSESGQVTTVEAFVNGVLFQEVTTPVPSTAPPSFYKINVVAEDGDTITFRVQGVNVFEGPQTWNGADSGTVKALNLSINSSSAGGSCLFTAPDPDKACSSGLQCCSDNTCQSTCTTSSGGGGGGGGGGGSSGGASVASVTSNSPNPVNFGDFESEDPNSPPQFDLDNDDTSSNVNDIGSDNTDGSGLDAITGSAIGTGSTWNTGTIAAAVMAVVILSVIGGAYLYRKFW